jgi:PPOX class probable F420-dependent enzyme
MDAHEIYRHQPTRDQIEAFLETRVNAVLGTLNPDGSIHLAFMLFLFQNGNLYFERSSSTAKARNVAARPTASFAVEAKGFMAMAQGTARLIDGAEAAAVNERLRAKYPTPGAAATVGRAWSRIDDVGIELTPTRWRSWSNAKFGQLSMEAADGLPPSEWWIGD